MIKLTIQVSDIDTVIQIYNTIRIYTSDAKEGVYTLLDTISLQPHVSTYEYLHLEGTDDTWYKSSYYNTSTGAESSLSDPTHGSAPSLFHNITYPVEYEFDADEEIIIRKIRRLIGDNKELELLVIDKESICDSDVSCNHVLSDGKTVNLDERGWPVYISLGALEFTSLTDPVVNGYQYLTFSGTLSTLSSGCQHDLTIWYYSFNFSDREIYEAYGDAMIPPNVPSNCVTQDHLILQASIDLLENLIKQEAMTDGASIRDDQTAYDPSPGLRERSALVDRLRKQLDALIKESIRSCMLGLEGVLLD